jgi:hypothetical protein
MVSVQRAQDALLQASDPYIRIIAGHVYRRKDKRKTAEPPPPPKLKAKLAMAPKKAEKKKLDTGDNGESDSDEEDKNRRFTNDTVDSPSNSKGLRLTVEASRRFMEQKIREFDLLFETARPVRKATD